MTRHTTWAELVATYWVWSCLVVARWPASSSWAALVWASVLLYIIGGGRAL